MVGIEPIGHPFTVNGTSGKGYEVAHIVAAAAAVMIGAQECPREVWDALED
ncbi:hypothetical protein [Nocardiopsis coralliicola]